MTGVSCLRLCSSSRLSCLSSYRASSDSCTSSLALNMFCCAVVVSGTAAGWASAGADASPRSRLALAAAANVLCIVPALSGGVGGRLSFDESAVSCGIGSVLLSLPSVAARMI